MVSTTHEQEMGLNSFNDSSNSQTPGCGQRVLLVEDDMPTLRLERVILEEAGYLVEGVGSGEDALHLIEEDPPALVLLDIGLPGMDGFETCQRIRESSEVPVLMVTGSKTASDRQQGADSGANGYVTKPFLTDKLVDLVAEVILTAAHLEEEKEQALQDVTAETEPGTAEISQNGHSLDADLSLLEEAFDEELESVDEEDEELPVEASLPWYSGIAEPSVVASLTLPETEEDPEQEEEPEWQDEPESLLLFDDSEEEEDLEETSHLPWYHQAEETCKHEEYAAELEVEEADEDHEDEELPFLATIEPKLSLQEDDETAEDEPTPEPVSFSAEETLSDPESYEPEEPGDELLPIQEVTGQVFSPVAEDSLDAAEEVEELEEDISEPDTNFSSFFPNGTSLEEPRALAEPLAEIAAAEYPSAEAPAPEDEDELQPVAELSTEPTSHDQDESSLDESPLDDELPLGEAIETEPETVAEDGEEVPTALYEGTIRLLVTSNGPVRSLLNFVGELRQNSHLRLLRLVANQKNESMDIWLGLREPLPLLEILGDITEVMSAVALPEPETDEEERQVSVTVGG